MTTVNIHEAKTNLSRLLDRVAKGDEIVIARAGKPIARLVPFRDRHVPRVPGTEKGKIWLAEDFGELPPDILEEFHKDDLR